MPRQTALVAARHLLGATGVRVEVHADLIPLTANVLAGARWWTARAVVAAPALGATLARAVPRGGTADETIPARVSGIAAGITTNLRNVAAGAAVALLASTRAAGISAYVLVHAARTANAGCAVFAAFLATRAVLKTAYGAGAELAVRTTRCPTIPKFGAAFVSNAVEPLFTAKVSACLLVGAALVIDATVVGSAVLATANEFIRIADAVEARFRV